MIFLIFFETRRSRQGETVYLQGNTGHRKWWRFRIQNSEFKEQIQRDSFDGVFGKLNHRLGMTPIAQQHLTP